MRRLAALLVTWCVASSAAAQSGEDLAPFTPRSLDYPDRAAALRPAGMVELSQSYAHGTYGSYGSSPLLESHYLFQSVDARIPYQSVIFEASSTGTFEHTSALRSASLDPGGPTRAIWAVYRVGNPRLGASWRALGRGFRLELGGAVNLAFRDVYLLEQDVEAIVGAGYYVARNETTAWWARGAWNWFQRVEGRLALIPHVRYEADFARDVVVGVEIELPLVIQVEAGWLAFTPQLAVEGAWRFLAHSMLGVRGQVVVFSVANDSYAVAASLEPFLRLGYATAELGYYGVLSALVYVGLDSPFDLAPSPLGSVAVNLAGGVLF